MMKYIHLLRPKHWIKNLFLFAAPFFGGRLFDEKTLLIVLPAFIAFSLSASAGYIFNDLMDIKKDIHHPKKRYRPIASGSIRKKNALIQICILVVVSLSVSYMIAPAFFYWLLFYLLIQLAYSLYLKNVAIVDIFCIASGFVIRVFAGGAAFDVEVSKWLLLTMFMISTVLAAGKRLGEVSLLNEKAESHRKSLSYYSKGALNDIFLISASASLITYTLYTIEQFQQLVYTVPIVTFGLFRYILLTRQGKGDPVEAVTQDKWLALIIFLWLFIVGLIRYG